MLYKSIASRNESLSQLSLYLSMKLAISLIYLIFTFAILYCMSSGRTGVALSPVPLIIIALYMASLNMASILLYGASWEPYTFSLKEVMLLLFLSNKSIIWTLSSSITGFSCIWGEPVIPFIIESTSIFRFNPLNKYEPILVICDFTVLIARINSDWVSLFISITPFSSPYERTILSTISEFIMSSNVFCFSSTDNPLSLCISLSALSTLPVTLFANSLSLKHLFIFG